eukprot:CAMPEP_0113830272 /NCGR_PEP_ID=MMETSP0328-20130328/6244_1 /TAXON_ID=39455 /ORGANISM="Alexandrium minutum" /LENGTH=66 /DNA_ID=CAMNT_0000798381 /DNA_START=11 /DNA_END=211 /DNA_ORIENTATION=- /assembly_acc=CAM_ASM_000350
MPHVFQEDKNKFVQVHAQKVEQMTTKKVLKRMRNSEYTKFLLGLEQEQAQKAEVRQARRKALRGDD